MIKFTIYDTNGKTPKTSRRKDTAIGDRPMAARTDFERAKPV